MKGKWGRGRCNGVGANGWAPGGGGGSFACASCGGALCAPGGPDPFGQGGGIEDQNFFCNFPQFPAIFPNCLLLAPPCALIGALCVPCAEVLLLEASGGLVTAPQFPAIFRNWI